MPPGDWPGDPAGPVRPWRAARPRWPAWPRGRPRSPSSSRASRSAAPARAWWPGARRWPWSGAARSAMSATGAAPFPAGGRSGPRLLIVGLAPAAHGGNRTGRVFTGDRSGDFLFASLYRCGWAEKPTSVSIDDGQRLIGARMVAAVRCAPPDNKPEPAERDTCAPWLRAELGLVASDLRVIVCLGGFAWQAIWPVLGRCGFTLPRPRPAFGHGAEVRLEPPRAGPRPEPRMRRIPRQRAKCCSSAVITQVSRTRSPAVSRPRCSTPFSPVPGLALHRKRMTRLLSANVDLVISYAPQFVCRIRCGRQNNWQALSWTGLKQLHRRYYESAPVAQGKRPAP